MANNYLRGVLGFKGERGYSAYEIAVMNGYKGTEKDWLATLGTSSHFDRKSEIFTATVGQTEFNLPDYYTSSSFIDVYVDGEHLDSTEYTLTDEKIILTNAITVEGTKVEIITITMSTNELPIVEEINDSTTNDVVLGGKSLYNLLPLNVKNFGAVGDGVTDDTQAFKNAINKILSDYTDGKTGSFTLRIPAGIYLINEKLSIYPEELQGLSTSEAFTIKIIGDGRTSTQLHFNGTDTDNGLYIKKAQVVMEDLLLIDINENSKYSLVVLGDETENGVLEVVKQSTFKNLNICGRPTAVEIRRIFDSSFYDCFFSSMKNNDNTDQNSSVFYIKPNTSDNSNSINFTRCHFENSESNSTLLKIHNQNNKYHHGITLLNCHFETRNLSTKSFDLEYAERVVFYGCSFSRNKYDLNTDQFTDVANVLTNTRLIAFKECIFSGTNNNTVAPYIKLNENIYALNIVNTYMYGEQSAYSTFLDCSNVNDYDVNKQTWNLDFSKGLVGYNRFKNNLHLSLEEGNMRYDFLNAKSKYYDAYVDELFIKLNSTVLPKAIDPNDTEQMSINYLGAITPSLLSGTHDYQMAAKSTQEIDIKMINNANRIGFYFIFDSEAGATPQYGIVFRAGVQLVKAVGTINVSATKPSSFSEENLYCYLEDNKIYVRNNNSAARRVMVLPIAFK